MSTADVNSSINNLIGTFSTINTGDIQVIPDKLVSIDTFNNRIGISIRTKVLSLLKISIINENRKTKLLPTPKFFIDDTQNFNHEIIKIILDDILKKYNVIDPVIIKKLFY